MPLWMDGGENEKEEKQRIKLAIKKSFRERKSLQARQRRSYNRAIRRGQSISKSGQGGTQLNKISQGECCAITTSGFYLTLQ